MTIDEYLRQEHSLRKKVEKAEERYNIMQSRLMNPGTNLNGTPTIHRNDNGHEARLTAYLDASKEFSSAYDEYLAYRHQLKWAKYNLLYWQVLVIERVYSTNQVMGYRDKLFGVADILDTKDRNEIEAKANEAEEHFAELLRAQGVDIE